VTKALDTLFKGFSFYREPEEEKEVQRQISEYRKMRIQFKDRAIQNKHLREKVEKELSPEINQILRKKVSSKKLLKVQSQEEQKEKPNYIQLNNMK